MAGNYNSHRGNRDSGGYSYKDKRGDRSRDHDRKSWKIRDDGRYDGRDRGRDHDNDYGYTDSYPVYMGGSQNGPGTGEPAQAHKAVSGLPGRKPQRPSRNPGEPVPACQAVSDLRRRPRPGDTPNEPEPTC